MQQSRIFVGMILILIFGEVLGLYGYVFYGIGREFVGAGADKKSRLIVALILNLKRLG